MDIKAKVEEIVAKVKADPTALAKFKTDPAGAIKDLTGMEVSAEEIKSVVSMVSEKFKLDSDGDGKIDILEGLGSKLDSDGDGKPDLGAASSLLGGFLKK